MVWFENRSLEEFPVRSDRGQKHKSNQCLRSPSERAAVARCRPYEPPQRNSWHCRPARLAFRFSVTSPARSDSVSDAGSRREAIHHRGPRGPSLGRNKSWEKQVLGGTSLGRTGSAGTLRRKKSLEARRA